MSTGRFLNSSTNVRVPCPSGSPGTGARGAVFQPGNWDGPDPFFAGREHDPDFLNVPASVMVLGGEAVVKQGDILPPVRSFTSGKDAFGYHISPFSAACTVRISIHC